MKLVFVFDGPIYYDEQGNYYEYALHGLYERYSYMADDITYLIRTFPVEKETRNTLIPKQVNIVSIPNYKSVKEYIPLKRKASKIIEETIINADIVVLRGSSSAHDAEKYVKKYNKPYIYECVDCPWDGYWNHSFLGKIIAPLAFFRAKRIIERAPFVYYVTNAFLQKRYPTRGKSIGCSNVVLNSIDEEDANQKKQRYKKLNKGTRIVFGTAAAIDVRYKGQEYVIKAMRKLVDAGFDVEYRLAGGNRLKSTYLKGLADKLGLSDRVIFCGSLNSSEMPKFYRGVDIYFQPSKQEGLPRSVIEAMSYGCVCMGSDVAGIPELLDESCVFRRGNVEDIVSRFVRICEPEELMQLSSGNFDKSKQYHIDVLNKRREQFYDEFLKKYELYRG